MQTYLVGGAVRDQLLGLPVNERDWVVVGATPEALLDQGYQQVGKDFPVFIHPDSGEEYALARKERKVDAGYTGFEFEFDSSISLEQDLQRRDLTINAIAQNSQGQLIDPYGGLGDIKARRLRHVSDAFAEDPLRVLRVARFQARLHHLGFSIDPKTFRLMQTLCESDELLALAPERIWRELDKGLTAHSPAVFVDTLYRCNALQKLLPELHKAYRNSDNLRDTHDVIGERIEKALDYMASNFRPLANNEASACGETDTKTNRTKNNEPGESTQRSQIAWAICCHALELLTTPKNLVAKTLAAVNSKTSRVAQLNQRLCCPKDHQRLAVLTAHYVHVVIQADKTNANTLVALLDYCDAWRRPEQFEQLLFIAECLTSTNTDSPQRNLGSIALLRQAHQNCLKITAAQFVQMGLEGVAIGDAIRNARKVAVGELKQQFKTL